MMASNNRRWLSKGPEMEDWAMNPQLEHVRQIDRLLKVVRQNSPVRHNLFPIQDPEAFKFYQKQISAFWTASEIQFTDDAQHYLNLETLLLSQGKLDKSKFNTPESIKKLAQSIRSMIKKIFGAFAGTDGLVVENLAFRFMLETANLEQMMFYTIQLAIEGVHAETYSICIDTVITDPEEKKDLFEAAKHNPFLAAIHQWVESYNQAPIAYRLIVFICTEGIFFPGFFGCIYWLRRFGLFPGFIFANEKIAPDEMLHQKFGEYRYGSLFTIEERLGEHIVHKLISEAVELAEQIILDLLPQGEDLLDLKRVDLVNFLRHIADRILFNLGYSELYKVDCKVLPTWLNDIALQQKANFYEVKVGNYHIGNINKALSVLQNQSNSIDQTKLNETEKVDYDYNNLSGIDF